MDKTLLIFLLFFASMASSFGQSRQVTAAPESGVLQWPDPATFRSQNGVAESGENRSITSLRGMGYGWAFTMAENPMTGINFGGNGEIRFFVGGLHRANVHGLGLQVLGELRAGAIYGGGANITGLSAANLASGTVPAARGGAGDIDGLLMANGGGQVSRAVPGVNYAAVPRYPVFNIQLPPGYSDFELKASTDNYETMVFFYHSPDPAKVHIPQQIWTMRPDVYFTDSQHADRRQWIRQSATQSISTMRVNGYSEIGGVILVVKDIGPAINPGNASLVWTYCAMSSAGYEKDSSGRSIWRPIQPNWTATPPSL